MAFQKGLYIRRICIVQGIQRLILCMFSMHHSLDWVSSIRPSTRPTLYGQGYFSNFLKSNWKWWIMNCLSPVYLGCIPETWGSARYAMWPRRIVWDDSCRTSHSLIGHLVDDSELGKRLQFDILFRYVYTFRGHSRGGEEGSVLHLNFGVHFSYSWTIKVTFFFDMLDLDFSYECRIPYGTNTRPIWFSSGMKSTPRYLDSSADP